MSETSASEATLNEPYGLRGLDLPNRAVLAPMTRISAHGDGRATERMRDYYRSFAEGGFGLLVTEGIYPDAAHSQGYLDQPGLATSAHVDSWLPVTAAVHEHGGSIIAQLMHAGPQGQGNPHVSGLRSASAVRARGEQAGMYRGSGPYEVPEALNAEEIGEVISSFAAAAVRARDAGFDGVEIHGANGYLVDAFLTDYLNERTDGYGGSPMARTRLAREIIEAVRAAVGNDFVVGIRISQGKVSDATHRWSEGVAEAETVFGALAGTSVDYLHTTEWKANAPAFPDEDARSLSQLAREFAPGLSIVANGHLDTGAEAAESLGAGGADLVAIGKAALAQHDWPQRVQQGRQLLDPLTPSAFGSLATIQDWELRASEPVPTS
ncbi:NADH:flavin oxidoreductase [Citricoccus muralis]|uniref:2,4-dienoyl-CoA reductase-like NADH-dependent reductase (Old Yellow Enzyme family) n=1 Tax=Citricoccus muralis TaxID=169134 RepID=A0A3D9LEE5_9MICC|nr:NADH:flavin oxidoreductase [Citricoccus muralis]REE04220.1 2,4-dienoyl-CoA reductase-like NADH-dependent reductase (Old Yellow Enzyme family) [Citricoccus muralis]